MTHADRLKRSADNQRGWVEALLYLNRNGFLNAAGQVEAAKLIAATNEWVDGLPIDLVMPPVPEDDSDAPLVVSGSSEASQRSDDDRRQEGIHILHGTSRNPRSGPFRERFRERDVIPGIVGKSGQKRSRETNLDSA